MEKVNVALVVTVGVVQVPPSSVAVCGADVVFVQVTLPPTGMVTTEGAKQYPELVLQVAEAIIETMPGLVACAGRGLVIRPATIAETTPLIARVFKRNRSPS
jgi:hypothetical protein